MTTIITILTDGYADWETALLNAAARTYYAIDTKFATPGGKPVTSSGGLKVTPDLAIEDIDVNSLDALVVNGGVAWTLPDAPDIGPTLVAAKKAGKIIAGICDGTRPFAKAGILDEVKHTSNSADTISGPGYGGASFYQDRPIAVVDGKVVTAPGVAPVSFMGGIMQALGVRDGNLDFFTRMFGAEHKAA